ncbi:MAG: hypothetical protein UV82_C0007G0007 [Candidatus Magasanikbacteria bacterium GW2011_GWD2_43_18]|uniref:Uncharacterized protein n=1 Tax=Candidatus Magasanikbacteria bacterium GW2011_GWE2_42_7 TaxID=1619052 RepID=A0A0G1B9P8_9BACT|nr:MAG: hypothetical protein UV18_C0009G0013 [Candidatus Magasanikbacteria bacterium GW2011_GWC2_42_27]KKS70012.1 MAG: hypothetical protein UV42_C0071G0006 [Candidatus Magasanikbacteria bacterium GW2011_GWE2_42_7]KKT04507.1 MAG: hypothetical protein UV82_C0007G0007 [Candidatus Magasanikbacteria bacterium GW2011_GWD2_43_18]KKT25606.1 MAG: hypothetical protein UW10_C0006G0072 [Candidatus Magasanikbacteria bacterium GW2011_GWA2_43_9]HCC13207.1 hypothetical protein [Candidatus Magasanikbacteria bac
MPPKKKEDDTMAEEKSKKSAQGGKVRTQKNVSPVDTTPVVSSSASTSTSKSSSKKHGSSGGATLFIIIVLLIAVVGVYAYQKKQTDSVVSKLSILESKLTDKIGQIEQGIGTVKQQAEEEKMNAIADATTKKYTSAKYDYSFIYPTKYKVISLNTDIDDMYKENIVLMRESDRELYADSLEGGPTISFRLYTNTENLPLVDWLTVNTKASNVSEETELLDTTIDGRQAYGYSWEGLGSADAVAVAFDGYVLLGTGWYMDEANIEIRGDFQAMVQSLSL